MKTTRIILIAAAAFAVAIGGSSMPAHAAPPTCDPAPAAYHVTQIAKANGSIFVEIGWAWDGVSVQPDCTGPLVGARVRNTGTQTWYARFPRTHGGVRVITIAAGSTQTYTAAQLASVGIDTIGDIVDLQLSLTP